MLLAGRKWKMGGPSDWFDTVIISTYVHNIYIHTSVHLYMHMYMYTYICTYIFTYVFAHIHFLNEYRYFANSCIYRFTDIVM